MQTLSVTERALWRPLIKETPRTIRLVQWWADSSRALDAFSPINRFPVIAHVNEWVDFVAWANNRELGDEFRNVTSARPVFDLIKEIDSQLETLVLNVTAEVFEAYRLYVLEQPIDEPLQDRKLRAVAFFYQSAGIRRFTGGSPRLQLPPCSVEQLTKREATRIRFPVQKTPLVQAFVAAHEPSPSEAERTPRLLNIFFRWFIRRRQLPMSLVAPTSAEQQLLDRSIKELTPEELLAYARWLSGPKRSFSVGRSQRLFVELIRFLTFLHREELISAELLELAVPGTLRELHWCDFSPSRLATDKKARLTEAPVVLFPLEPIDRLIGQAELTVRSQEQARLTLWRYASWLGAERNLHLRRHAPLSLRVQLAIEIRQASKSDITRYRTHVIATHAGLASNTRAKFAAVKSMYAALESVSTTGAPSANPGAANPAADVPFIASAELRSPAKQREHNRKLTKRVRPKLRCLESCGESFVCKNISPLWDFLWWWAAREQFDLTPPVPLQTEYNFEASFSKLDEAAMLSYREKLRQIKVRGIIPLQQRKLRMALQFVKWLGTTRRVQTMTDIAVPILRDSDFNVVSRSDPKE